jgi:hypothetical protein
LKYLRLDQDKINEYHDKVMLNVLVGEAFAARALRQTHAFAKGPIICATVGAVQVRDRIRAFDADGHRQSMPMMSSRLLMNCSCILLREEK